MKFGYDIFQKLQEGGLLWITNVQTRGIRKVIRSVPFRFGAIFCPRRGNRCGTVSPAWSEALTRAGKT